MKRTFQKLEFRNFLSYGNKITEIVFGASGIVSITGENGNGKSVFEDALSMVLYGKPYRKIKNKEVKNRTNSKSPPLKERHSQKQDLPVGEGLIPFSATFSFLLV